MFSDKIIFRIALLISLVTHGAILIQNPNLTPFPVTTKEQKLEVSYLKEAWEVKKYPKTVISKNDPFLKSTAKISADRKIPPPFVDKENIFKNIEASRRQASIIKPAFTRPDIIAIKKKITLPAVDIDKINNSSYISYYQIVREKIKRAAYQNYTHTDTGEAYLSFVISNDGYLKEIKLVEEKSAPSPYLREIALRSIKDASPFPNFPKELDYPQLSFNVIISFEIE
jgi:TonB family protein